MECNKCGRRGRRRKQYLGMWMGGGKGEGGCNDVILSTSILGLYLSG